MSAHSHTSQHEESIRVGDGPGGAVTYLVDLPPESLPSVGRRDLELAWYAARDAAIAQDSGAAKSLEEEIGSLRNSIYSLNTVKVQTGGALAQNSDQQNSLRRELPVLESELVSLAKIAGAAAVANFPKS